MKIELKRNDGALWTEPFVSMREIDGPEPLGLDYTKEQFFQIAANLRRLISAGVAEPRQSGKMLWEVLVDGVVAGDISLDPDVHPLEFTLSILPEYRGQGVATQALKEFLRNYTNRPLKAVVLPENPKHLSMDHLLRSAGFQLIRGKIGKSAAHYRIDTVS